MKTNIYLLVMLAFCGLGVTMEIQAQSQPAQYPPPYPPVYEEPANNNQTEEEQGTLVPSGFESFESEEEEPTLETETIERVAPPTTFQPNASEERPAKAGVLSNIRKGKKKRRGKNIDPNVISLDLDVLYTVNIRKPVEVRDKRTTIPFKIKEDIKYFYNQALTRINNKDYEGALVFLEKCLAKDPYNKELLQLRANAYTETDHFKKAIKDYNKALIIAPNDPVLHYNKASTLAKIEKLDQAINAYTSAIALRPDYTRAWQGRASAKTLTGDLDGAVSDYNEVLDQNMGFTPAIKGRGVAKSLMGRYDEAINDFSYIIEQQEMDGLAYYYRGLAYIKNNQLYRGCADLDKAYQLKINQAYFDIKEICR